MTQPDYVTCVLLGMFDPERVREGDPNAGRVKTTWCGRENIISFAFLDASHAALHVRMKGRLLICPECSAELVKTILGGTSSV